MDVTTHNSDSATQRGIEITIFEKLKNISEIQNKLGSNKLKSEGLTIKSVKFQVDFHDEEIGVFGEIYASTFPLKSGHSRKIKGDILKLITIEKMVNKPVSKFLILTISQKDLGDSKYFPECSFIPHGSEENELNFLGQKSWFNETLLLFDVQVFYYLLSESERCNLDSTRSKQKLGMQV